MTEMTDRQRKLFERLRRGHRDLLWTWDSARGVLARARSERLAAPEGAANFLARYGPLFGPENLEQHLGARMERSDDLGWTRRTFTQHVIGDGGQDGLERGPEVYGGRLTLHLDQKGSLIEVQSSCWRDTEFVDEPRVSLEELRTLLDDLGRRAPGYLELAREMRKRDEPLFPLMQRPTLVAYPWKNVIVPAWVVHAYGPTEADDPEQPGGPHLALGETVVDAVNGARLVFAPTRKHVDNPTTGSGTAVTPLGSPATRAMRIIQVDATNVFHLRDTTHARDVITFDAGASSTMATTAQIVAGIAGGTLARSADIDGDATWGRTPTNTTDAQRTSGQQPEVDAHFLCGDIYEWFDALAGGRAGWDNGNFANPPVPTQPVRVLTHVFDNGAATSRSVNAFMDKGLQGGLWYAFLAFFDGNPTATCTVANDRAFDYLAGSPFIVAHEYQHAMTDFAFESTAGNPGLTYAGWFSAVHEGLSDVFGCLYSQQWVPGPEISSAGLVFRNLAFPRDPASWVNRPGPVPCGLSNHNKDHWNDRNLDGGFRYDRGTILAHAAYLIGAGGVHQRAARTPALIPVQSLGSETRGGRDLPRAARIWYRALHTYFSTHGNLTGVPANDESAFRTLRDGCESAAIDIYGAGSREHRQTVLAFYACGLHPTTSSYGADVTFMPWGAAWWRSRPYIGLSSPDWSSVDLFINNGGLSEWNAQINVVDAGGNPTQFENTVYCRVRNIGDLPASGVNVSFFYAKVGTAPSGWLPMTDRNGVAQTLAMGSLGASQSTFPDAQQGSPPATASVKWWVPPIPAGETVDHYCIRAVVSATNDVNTYNNEVQSNVAYVAYVPAGAAGFAFTAGNPTEEPVRLELSVHHALPKGWRVTTPEARRKTVKPGEMLPVQLTIEMPKGAAAKVEAPFDGDIVGQLSGMLTGELVGTLTAVTGRASAVTARVAGTLVNVGSITGTFRGNIDPKTGRLDGTADIAMHGTVGCECDSKVACTRLVGHLRPWRRIDIAQIIDGQAVGGVTIQVQIPGPGVAPLPPTTTRMS